jgi:hypothetical protein
VYATSASFMFPRDWQSRSITSSQGKRYFHWLQVPNCKGDLPNFLPWISESNIGLKKWKAILQIVLREHIVTALALEAVVLLCRFASSTVMSWCHPDQQNCHPEEGGLTVHFYMAP